MSDMKKNDQIASIVTVCLFYKKLLNNNYNYF
jgi:hypothetical protein